ncbi:hypothetical protein BDW68DRAFT_189294 [Aspergillus falconensis]
MIAPRQPPFAAQRGFTAITDRDYIRNVCDEPFSPPLAEEQKSTTVVIFGWGDAALKHVSKYSDGYHSIFPSARIGVVLSRILQALAQRLESRIEAMMPVIDIVFPTPRTLWGKRERILLHAMSNTGAIFPTATLLAYERRQVFDSTPGSLNFASQVPLHVAAIITNTQVQAVSYMALWANWAWEKLCGTEPPAIWTNRAINDLAIVAVESHRLSMYSKEDEIIWWEDLVQAVAQAKALGYSADLEMFAESPHVGHMRLHPEQYWKTVLSVWEGAHPKH